MQVDASDELAALLGSDRVRCARGFRHRSPMACALHSHDAFELVYHLSGRGDEWTAAGARAAFAGGCISLHPPGLAHAQRMHEPGEDCCVHFTVAGRAPPELARGLLAQPVTDIDMRQACLSLSAPDAGDPLAHALRDHLARAALTRACALARSRLRARDPVADAQQHLRERFREAISIAAVAAAVGLGPDHLRHRFRDRIGMTMHAFLTAVRVGRARVLLEHSRLPIDESARQCGYASHRHLGVVFRRAHGCTPRAWRARAAGVREPR